MPAEAIVLLAILGALLVVVVLYALLHPPECTCFAHETDTETGDYWCSQRGGWVRRR